MFTTTNPKLSRRLFAQAARFFLLLVAVTSSSCNADEEQYSDIDLSFRKPENFPNPRYNYEANKVTRAGFELGKKLFYDGRLSSDGVVSCGFCHEQAFAFTHHGHSVSHGVNEQLGTRNSMPIQNLGFYDSFMWDGAVDHLDLIAVVALTSEIEMNGNFQQMLSLFGTDPEYKRLFEQAFPNEQISTENMLLALGQFMSLMVSSNSKFDKWQRAEDGVTLTAEEESGYEVFQQKCASCHAGNLFTDQSFRNNGLAINPFVNDLGKYRTTQIETDKYKFKVPSLRNVLKSAPYMHDGRFRTLDAVLDHYTSGIQQTQNIDPSLINGIQLSETEKVQIKAFLNTLTDEEFLNDSRFAPF
ncbi:cytochrome c peroxidase [Flavobacterium sp.]|uniref:cytochrome-c peroxidase n=1 Tax=Flavobacterium sp. TaxID=239 RepID=UPI002608F05D|nr:cytochrome c peroxidase [Flavobacterium sp.]